MDEQPGSQSPSAASHLRSARPAAPPTSPGQITGRRPAQWPSVIGTISIILGSLGSLIWFTQSATNLLFGAMVRPAPPAPSSPAPGMVIFDPVQTVSALAAWAVPSAIAYMILCLASILLTIAGAGLARRKRWGHTWIIRWSYIKILAALPACLIASLAQLEQMRMVSTSMQRTVQSSAQPPTPAPPTATATATPSTPATTSPPSTTPPAANPSLAAQQAAAASVATTMNTIGPAMAITTGVLMLLWLCAYPLFILIWFSREKNKSETNLWT